MPADRHLPAFHSLRIQDLVLRARLGWCVEEREQAQEVLVTVELRFMQAPLATHSDQLEGTVCYGKMSQRIRSHCESREYKLIERLAVEIYGVVRDFAGTGAQVSVDLHKVNAPVHDLLGGANYRCGDFAL